MTKKGVFKPILTTLLLCCFLLAAAFSQPLDPGEIKRLVEAFKKDERGPFQAIRWFCPDGSVIPPNQQCRHPGVIQHGLHKDVVQRLAKQQSLFLGQILAGTPFPERKNYW